MRAPRTPHGSGSLPGLTDLPPAPGPAPLLCVYGLATALEGKNGARAALNAVKWLAGGGKVFAGRQLSPGTMKAAVPHDDSGAEKLLPKTQRQRCRTAICEILRAVRPQQNVAADNTNDTTNVVDLTSLSEENVNLDTAALRLEIALYVAFPFAADGNGAAATAKDSSVTGRKISYSEAAASLQKLLQEQASKKGSPGDGDANGLLAQVLGGKICAEQLGPVVADAAMSALAAGATGEVTTTAASAVTTSASITVGSTD